MEKMKTPEGHSVDRRIFLLAAVSAGIAGCTNENKTKMRGALAKETPIERWRRFSEIAERLEQRGDTVEWNHPSEGPTDPIFIVSNNHVGQFATNVADQRQALTILSEYKNLRFLIDEAGMKRIACEGVPADGRFPRPRLFKTEKPSGHIGLDVVKNPASEGPPKGRQLSAAEVRELFSHDIDALKFISTVPGLKSIAVDMASASTDDASVEFGGAEDPKEMEFMKRFMMKRQRDMLYFDRFRKAAIQEFSGGKKIKLKHSTDSLGQRIVRVGSEEFDAETLEYAILVSLGETEEDKELSQRRESFIAGRLRADVVHFGNGHAENFLKMNASRSLGVILSPAAKRNMESRKDRTDLQYGTLDALKNIEKTQ